jgi:hypothetical protein
MGERAKCDFCGTPGPRRIGHICPEGWLYAEVPIVDDGGCIIEKTIVSVCSLTCSVRMWKTGPGKLFGDPDMSRADRILEQARAEGRAEERRDVVAFLRRCEGWRAPKLAESIDDECHVGDHELYSAAKDSP